MNENPSSGSRAVPRRQTWQSNLSLFTALLIYLIKMKVLKWYYNLMDTCNDSVLNNPNSLTRIYNGTHAYCTALAQSQTASTLSWSVMCDTESTYQNRQDEGEASLTWEKDYANMHPPVLPEVTQKFVPLISYWKHFNYKCILMSQNIPKKKEK